MHMCNSSRQLNVLLSKLNQCQSAIHCGCANQSNAFQFNPQQTVIVMGLAKRLKKVSEPKKPQKKEEKTEAFENKI